MRLGVEGLGMRLGLEGLGMRLGPGRPGRPGYETGANVAKKCLLLKYLL